MKGSAQAIAHSNIALVKYWGKRSSTSRSLNLPEVGSISITLGELETRTEVSFDAGLDADDVRLNGEPEASGRVSAFLDLVRSMADAPLYARVESHNNFPTSAGLASSASGFAALASAATRAAGLFLDGVELSRLARQGSGSAARSVFGGFVELHRGEREDGEDCFAEQIAAANHWPLQVLVAVTTEEPKSTGSTSGMERTALTSPYYRAFAAGQPDDLDEAREAIRNRDMERLARVTERSCLKMHAAMMTSEPPLMYWRPATLAACEEVRRLREGGVPVCFTMDAGPQVKAICEPEYAAVVAQGLGAIPGVRRVIVSGLGEGVR